MKPFLITKEIQIDDIGNIQVPYIAFPKGIIFKKIKDGDTSSLPDLVKDAVGKININSLQPAIRAYPINSKRILIEVPFPIPDLLLNELIFLGEITLFTEDPSGKKSEKVYNLTYIKTRRDGTKLVFLPSYAIGLIEEIFAKYGLSIQVDLGISLEKVKSIKENFKLMPHQAQALHAWLSNRKRGTIVIPTGGGKTHVALAAIARIQLPSIIFVPNTWLIDQWINHISHYLGIPKGLIGVLGGGKRTLKPITVATYQSGYRYIDEITDKFALVIFDEAHHVPARTFKEIALNLRAIYRMALSATPKRRDGNEILLFKLVGNIVYNISYRDLVLKGIVAPVVVRKILVSLPADRLIIYRQYERRANRALNDIERRKYVNKMIEIARDNPIKLDIIRYIVHQHKSEKIFIFAGSIKFAEEIAKKLQAEIPVAVLTSKTDATKEEKIIRGFQRGSILCLILVKKGEEGVDVGDASVAIIAGGTKQERELIQRVGRILRGGNNKLAYLYEVVTKNTIEEVLSKARNARRLVIGLEDYIKRKYNLRAYEVLKWDS